MRLTIHIPLIKLKTDVANGYTKENYSLPMKDATCIIFEVLVHIASIRIITANAEEGKS